MTHRQTDRKNDHTSGNPALLAEVKIMV